MFNVNDIITSLDVLAVTVQDDSCLTSLRLATLCPHRQRDLVQLSKDSIMQPSVGIRNDLLNLGQRGRATSTHRVVGVAFRAPLLRHATGKSSVTQLLSETGLLLSLMPSAGKHEKLIFAAHWRQQRRDDRY